jgi:nicotinamide-nucleotide amidase
MKQVIVISIGTEMITGARIDTNSAWISEQLNLYGYHTALHATVGDVQADHEELMRDIVGDCDLIVMTGGLGPTLDDLTRDVLANVFDAPLELDQPSLDFIQSMFSRRGRPMPERNVVQAYFPRGSEILLNPIGTAPGIWMKVPKDPVSNEYCLIAALPGVPVEMKKMFLEQVIPRLPNSGETIKMDTMQAFGMGESQCEVMLGDITSRGRDPEVGITVHQATITLRIVARGTTTEECQQKIVTTRQQIQDKLGDFIYGEHGAELEESVLALLQERQLKVSSCEWGRSGGLITRLSALGASFPNVYQGGLSIPALSHLGETTTQGDSSLLEPIAAEYLLGKSSVEEIQAAMVKSLAEISQLLPADAIVMTMIPYVTGKTLPKAIIGLSLDGMTYFEQSVMFEDDSLTLARTSKAALNLLRLKLLRAEALPGG